ncbi:hypothetical protein ABID23_000655 [Bartonella silvatica]|uniref:Uncharacterized protein n=1 Tax=Bartonella silvatica TaxID=357760 RepID=A0ABV2HG90_9HYPH
MLFKFLYFIAQVMISKPDLLREQTNLGFGGQGNRVLESAYFGPINRLFCLFLCGCEIMMIGGILL